MLGRNALQPEPLKERRHVKPSITVVIPLYNKEAYVHRALASVAAQTKSDFEVLVVDDGSEDAGPEIARSFGDRRLRIIHQANSGPGAARNRGIAEAQGEFIAFLDADDEWHPTYLERSSRLLNKHSSAASVTSGYIEYPSRVSREAHWSARGISAGERRIGVDASPKEVVAMLAYMCPWSTMVRREVLRRWAGFTIEIDACMVRTLFCG